MTEAQCIYCGSQRDTWADRCWECDTLQQTDFVAPFTPNKAARLSDTSKLEARIAELEGLVSTMAETQAKTNSILEKRISELEALLSDVSKPVGWL